MSAEIFRYLFHVAYQHIRAFINSRLGLATLFLSSLLLLVLGTKVYARIPEAAVIKSVSGPGISGIHFWMRRTSPDSGAKQELIRDIPNISDGNSRIQRGGQLSVPTDGNSLASLYFEGGGESYDGLVVTTRPLNRSDRQSTLYEFPCRFSGGEYLLAWNANSGGACRADDTNPGIEIKRNGENSSSSIRSTDLVVGTASIGKKQNSSEEDSELPSDDVEVNPGAGPVVIRTSTRLSTETAYILERCDVDFVGDYCQREIPVRRDAINIEVLEGEIFVKSEQDPEGETVLEGQSFSYPKKEFTRFDVGQAANSCEVLRFLNAAYWIDSGTSQNIADGITQQLHQHRDYLGISGRTPNGLSSLERDIFAELNRVRSNPGTYADLLEENKQYLNNNYLNLPGETANPNSRSNAVSGAISFLREQRNLPELSISKGMSAANRDHILDQGKSGKFAGHTGENSSGAGARLRRYGSVGCPPSYDEDEFENIVYFDQSAHQGSVPASQAVVMEMLITYRPRRTGNPANLFNPDFQVTGVACGPHSDFLPDMCVITYANGYVENADISE
ncbi:CAP domain-containing protein [Leptothoe sp. EHU-05/26/07-4]